MSQLTIEKVQALQGRELDALVERSLNQGAVLGGDDSLPAAPDLHSSGLESQTRILTHLTKQWQANVAVFVEGRGTQAVKVVVDGTAGWLATVRVENYPGVGLEQALALALCRALLCVELRMVGVTK